MSDMDTTPHTLQEVALTRSEKIFRSRYGLWGLGFISYVESALIVPIVTDPFLIAFILANRPKAFIAVIVAILTSVLGGLTAYVLAALFAAVLLPFLGPESLAQFNAIAVEVQAETFVLTILGALTPVPYTLVAMAAGFVKGNLLSFVAASLLARILRYGLIGYLTYWFGPQVVVQLKRHTMTVVVVTVVSVAAYLGWKFL